MEEANEDDILQRIRNFLDSRIDDSTATNNTSVEKEDLSARYILAGFDIFMLHMFYYIFLIFISFF